MSGVCNLANRIGSYSSSSTTNCNVQIANIDAVDVQANHGSFTTLTINGTDLSGDLSDITQKTQYMFSDALETTFTSHVVVPSLEVSGGSFTVPNLTSTNITATNITTPDEVTSMKLGSASKTMVSLNPGSGYVGINMAAGSTSFPLDVTGTTRVSAPTTSTSTTQIVRAFVPSLATSASNEAQILFGVSSSSRRCGVLAYNYNDSVNTTTNTNKISLYNQGTTTPRLDIDSNFVAISGGKLKPTGCTSSFSAAGMTNIITGSTLGAAPYYYSIPLSVPFETYNTSMARKFRVHFYQVRKNTITPFLQIGGAGGYDATIATYENASIIGNNAGSGNPGTVNGIPLWNTDSFPNGIVNGFIQFEYIGHVPNQTTQALYVISGTLCSPYAVGAPAGGYGCYFAGNVVCNATNPVITSVRISTMGSANWTGGFVQLTYDA